MKTFKAITIKNKDLTKDDFSKYVAENAITLNVSDMDSTGRQGWFIGDSTEIALKKKIEKAGKPLKDWDVKIYRGVLTGLNEAFIIGEEKMAELITADPKSAEIIKPILRGRDIKRYSYEFAGLYMICTFPALNLDINNYPAIKKHLIDFGKEQLEQSGKDLGNGKKARKKTGNAWFETQDQIAYWKEFEKEKVVWGNISYDACFCYSKPGDFVNAPANIITSDTVSIKYIVACMNSNMFNWEFKQNGIFLGKAYEWKKQYVETVHLPIITNENKNEIERIENLVDQILENKKQKKDADTKDLEKEIDKLVYKLYDLTEEEIKIIEENK